jgi:hypothetical protein
VVGPFHEGYEAAGGQVRRISSDDSFEEQDLAGFAPDLVSDLFVRVRQVDLGWFSSLYLVPCLSVFLM